MLPTADLLTMQGAPPIGRPGEMALVHAVVVAVQFLVEGLLTAEMSQWALDAFQRTLLLASDHGADIIQLGAQGLHCGFSTDPPEGSAGLRAPRLTLAIRDRFQTDTRHVPGSWRPAEVHLGMHTGLLFRHRAGDSWEGGALALTERVAASTLHGLPLATPDVARLIADEIDLCGAAPAPRAIGPLPSPLFLLLGDKDAQPQRERVRHEVPFIGRERELSTLMQLQRDAVAATGELVVLVAEPGIGKTRLLHELQRRFLADGGPLAWWQADGSPYGGGPGWLARDLLEQRLSALGGVPLPLARLDALIGEAGLSDEQTVSPLRSLLQGRAGPAPASVATALAALIRPECEHRQVVLVLDDLHWADPTSLGVVGHLLEWLQGAPLLTILSFRPSFEGRIPWTWPSGTHWLHLTPLSSGEIERLAAALVPAGAQPTGIWGQVPAYAKGNPLYVEHAAALVAERLAARPGQDSMSVPSTLHGVILARIDQLFDARARPLHDQASWARDRPFERDRVVAELDGLERDIAAWLDRLETGDYRDRAEIGAYLLRLHAIEQEMALAAILLGQPRRRMGRLNQALRRLALGSPDEYLAALTRYRERGNVWAAIEQAVAAADHVFAADQPELAARYLKLAVTACPVDSRPVGYDRSTLPLRLGQAHLLAGQPRAAELAFREAAADASHQARPEPLLGLARALSAQGQMSQALETLAEARRAARTPAEEIAVLLGRAQIYRLAGASARAARAARIARRRAEAAGLEEVTARSHLLLAAASKSPARAGRHLGAGVQRIEIWNADSRDLAMEAVRAIARPGRGTLPET